MSSVNLSVNVRADKLIRALATVPRQLEAALKQAGKESADRIILPTQGLKSYPPAGSGNQPPVPYYIRGKGTQTATGNRYNSERLGSQFYAESRNRATYIGNRASYAPRVVGDLQSRRMQAIGWRQLYFVALQKMNEITAVYDRWIDWALKQAE